MSDPRALPLIRGDGRDQLTHGGRVTVMSGTGPYGELPVAAK
ncbi:hypothetical protein AB0N73_07800 [Microbacterium sp. NPDC089189]